MGEVKETFSYGVDNLGAPSTTREVFYLTGKNYPLMWFLGRKKRRNSGNYYWRPGTPKRERIRGGL